MAIALAGVAFGSACSGGSSAVGIVGGGGGGPVGSVFLGPGIQFTSDHNGSTNPAVDTIPVGGTVTWSWRGSLPHSVQSTGGPAFTSSAFRSGSGTHAVTFTAPGTYRYICGEHGQLMTGRVVVQ
jgi:hypothetical protein